LILGWNQRAPSIINELEAYVTMGSQVSVIADYEDGKAYLARLCPDLKHIQLTYQVDDTTDRRVLEGISPHTYHYVIVLSYSDTRGIQDADACTLMTLLHLRDMQEKSGQDFAIVSEMQDVQNRALAEVTQADDFIVSDRIISLILTQVSENKRLNAVFTDIFDPDGSEIYLKQAGHYVKMGEPVNFYTVVAAAARRGEVAIGYRLKKYAGQAEKSYGVRVNPDKSEKIAYGPGDRFIVLAEG
jgi:hypothetical protein